MARMPPPPPPHPPPGLGASLDRFNARMEELAAVDPYDPSFWTRLRIEPTDGDNGTECTEDEIITALEAHLTVEFPQRPTDRQGFEVAQMNKQRGHYSLLAAQIFVANFREHGAVDVHCALTNTIVEFTFYDCDINGNRIEGVQRRERVVDAEKQALKAAVRARTIAIGFDYPVAMQGKVDDTVHGPILLNAVCASGFAKARYHRPSTELGRKQHRAIIFAELGAEDVHMRGVEDVLKSINWAQLNFVAFYYGVRPGKFYIKASIREMLGIRRCCHKPVCSIHPGFGACDAQHAAFLAAGVFEGRAPKRDATQASTSAIEEAAKRTKKSMCKMWKAGKCCRFGEGSPGGQCTRDHVDNVNGLTTSVIPCYSSKEEGYCHFPAGMCPYKDHNEQRFRPFGQAPMPAPPPVPSVGGGLD